MAEEIKDKAKKESKETLKYVIIGVCILLIVAGGIAFGVSKGVEHSQFKLALSGCYDTYFKKNISVSLGEKNYEIDNRTDKDENYTGEIEWVSGKKLLEDSGYQEYRDAIEEKSLKQLKKYDEDQIYIAICHFDKHKSSKIGGTETFVPELYDGNDFFIFAIYKSENSNKFIDCSNFDGNFVANDFYF